jgi:sulfate adenylyltransferase subunit 1 (EFTu-like GTPase family)
VDHGKSTFVGRLFYDTGSLPTGKYEQLVQIAERRKVPFEWANLMDSLQSERDQNITIDTAQIWFSTPRRQYVIIDAPGHKEFIKNMITGASQAEAAVLICSVAEGVQEQTKRHAYVIKMLGIEQVIVAYNKMDLASYDEERLRQVKGEMDAFLGRIGVRPCAEVPISARHGDNVATRSDRMPWHDGPTVVDALEGLAKTPPASAKALRFPVQDVYSHDGRPIVAGRVESGMIRASQALRFLPHDRSATVQRILIYGRDEVTQAEAGECIGLMLDRDDVGRGQVGCPQGDVPRAATRFRASVFWLSPVPGRAGRSGDALAFKCATQEQPCRILELQGLRDSGSLEQLPVEPGLLQATEVGQVVIETAAPVVLESFYDVRELGRFVLQRGREVVAGGIVTHP